MSQKNEMSPRERLVFHVQHLEQLEAIKNAAAERLRNAFDRAKDEGYDAATLRVVLKLRKMTEGQRRERRALEAIYMAALGMLEGDDLPMDARRRLDGAEAKPKEAKPGEDDNADAKSAGPRDADQPQEPPAPEQPAFVLKDPAEARQEGIDAAAAGKRVYDNPYSAGDPCRAAWDEGWCSGKKSNGMETPDAFRRRTEKPTKGKSEKKGGDDEDESGGDAGEESERGAA